jgi:hypothetical protein
MKVGFCFSHGGFPLPEEVDAGDQETWSHIECPGCYDAKIPLADQEWFVLGGTLDGAEPLRFIKKTGTLYMVLHDLKTMQEYKVDKFVCGEPEGQLHTHTSDDYYYQAQIYRYLAEHSDPPKFMRDKGIKQLKFVEARLQGFAMGKAPYMGTNFWHRKHWKHPFTKWFIPSIQFEEDAWVETYIRSNGRSIYDSLLTDMVRAPICEPEGKGPEHSWKCKFCAFAGSEHCPDPVAEWKHLREGRAPTEAFELALESRMQRDET